MSIGMVRSLRDPQPPRLHWTVVLTLSIMTLLAFGEIWLAVQANWIRRVTGRRRALTWSIVNLCVLPILVFLAFVPQIVLGYLGMPRRYVGPPPTFSLGAVFLGALLNIDPAWCWLAAITMSSVTAFIVRAEMQGHTICLRLGAILTFFFGPIYFQYFLDDLLVSEELQKTAYVPPTSPESQA